MWHWIPLTHRMRHHCLSFISIMVVALGELTSLLSSEIEINKCNVQCCVYITDGGKWRLCQNIALDPIAFDSKRQRRYLLTRWLATARRNSRYSWVHRSVSFMWVASSFMSEWRSFLLVSFLFEKNCTFANAEIAAL